MDKKTNKNTKKKKKKKRKMRAPTVVFIMYCVIDKNIEFLVEGKKEMFSLTAH